MKDNQKVTEDKSSNAKMQIAKKDKWKELSQQMKASGGNREWTELRAAYQRWKVTARKTVTNYKKYLKSTGGGPSMPTPSDIDYSIADICPEDFEVDENNHDSDGQVSFTHNKNVDFTIAN